MLTFQDFEEYKAEGKISDFITLAISEHKNSELYKMAVTADAYDHQRNVTINNYVKLLFQLTGEEVVDFTASNAKLASNFVNRCCTQRCNYSLGNGVRFTVHIDKKPNEEGVPVPTDTTKEKLGQEYDTAVWTIGYFGILHGLCFGYRTVEKLHAYKITEFAPLWDEDDGRLRAGIRFWQIDTGKPMIAELYEEDGVTTYKRAKDETEFKTDQNKPTAYKITTSRAKIESEDTVVGEENYGSLPITPFWGSRLHQSILVGKQQTIDSYDIINSGFANDLTDCSQIFWIVENCGGMTPADLGKLRDRMKLLHIIEADTGDGGSIKPYTQEIPYQARSTMLSNLRAQIYEDFCCLDVHTIAAGATNDHIDAGYQPMDDAADDFEYQLIQFIQQDLSLLGIEDTPDFKRGKISNTKEQVEVVLMEAQYLDDETILSKLPNVTPDEVPGIIARRLKQMQDRMKMMQEQQMPGPATGPDETDEEVVV